MLNLNMNGKMLAAWRMVLAGCVFAPTAYAAEWSVKSDIKQNIAYDDNVRMRKEAQGSMFYTIMPRLAFAHKTEVSNVTAMASYGTQRYEAIEGLNQDIQAYDLNANYSTEKWAWGVVGAFDATPSRNSAVDDAGNFASTAIRTVKSISPSLSYTLFETDRITLAPSYSETSYSQSGFSNNSSRSANLSWVRQWSEAYQTSLSGFFSNYEFGRINGISQTSTTSNSYGVNFGNNYTLSERWAVNLSVGIRQVENNSLTDFIFFQETTTSTSTGFLTDSGVSYTGENFSGKLRLSRSLVPSGQGQLQEQSSIGIGLGYNLSETVRAKLDSSYQENDSTNPTQSISRKNINFAPSVSWHLSTEWVLSASYRYRQQDNNSTIGAVDSNLFMVGVNYDWQGLSFSR
ncbi:hypothetical protein JCM14076_02110 [Methylosoma difficile]